MPTTHAPSIALFAALLVGCANIQPTNEAAPVRRTVDFPNTTELTSVSIGAPMLIRADGTFARRGVVLAPYSRSILLGRLNVPAGEPLVPAVVDGVQSWCANRPLFSAPGEVRNVCMREEVPAEGNRLRLSKLYIAGSVQGFVYDIAVDIDVQDIAIGPGRREELLYLGAANGVLRLSYREFVNDLARPAFTQDLTFTLSPRGPTSISFRDRRLEVISADNNEIRYRIPPG